MTKVPSIHRERFDLCMTHQVSDKIPCDLWIDSNDPSIQTALIKATSQRDYEGLLDFLDIDIYRFKPKAIRVATGNDIASFFLPPPDSRYLSFSSDALPRLLSNVEDPAALDQFDWPTGEIFDYSNIPAILDAQKHRVLWAQAGTWSPLFCKVCELCGMEKTLMDMVENPELIHAIMARIIVFYKDTFCRTLEAAGDKLDVFGFGDDFTTQQGPMFSKAYWDMYFKEPMRELVQLIKSYGVYVAFHSCGAIRDYIADFIDLGINIIFPIQPRAMGMEPEGLKKDFGSKTVFYGGIDVQHILPFGTEAEVRSEVDRYGQIMGKDGGYIIASSHGFLKDVPVKNILAMYDEVKQLSKGR